MGEHGVSGGVTLYPSRPQWAEGAELITYVEFPWTKTWGSESDKRYQAEVLAKVKAKVIHPGGYQWFAIYLVVGTSSRSTGRRKGPDIDNHFRVITDALIGFLYPDDDVQSLRAVAAEGRMVAPGEERTQVWIYGAPKPGSIQ